MSDDSDKSWMLEGWQKDLVDVELCGSPPVTTQPRGPSTKMKRAGLIFFNVSHQTPPPTPTPHPQPPPLPQIHETQHLCPEWRYLVIRIILRP